MSVTRGLIIADPWIDHILEGRKDWEMRSQATAVRGWFALIRKGSGLVVGLARLIDCGNALSQSEMIASVDRHRIPEEMIRRGEVSKWVVPWKLADIKPLEQPVPYEHKSGAVTWVTLSPSLTGQLGQYLERMESPVDPVILPPARTLERSAKLSVFAEPTEHSNAMPNPSAPPSAPLLENKYRLLGRSRLTGGNVRNNHINLSKFMDAFPQDVIGGKNKTEAAPRQIEIDWGGPQHVVTDIDGSKSIFRGRGWIRRFLAASDAQEGDIVVLAETAPYKLSVRLERRASEV